MTVPDVPDDAQAAPPRNVLIGVDDTDESRHAVRVAYDFFGSSSEYTIVSVHENPPLIVGMSGVGTTVAGMYTRLDETVGQQIAQNTTSQARSEAPDDADVTFRNDVGDAGRIICEIAADESSDLIVIGSHDNGFWERLFTPSVSKYLVGHAPCPVLIVR